MTLSDTGGTNVLHMGSGLTASNLAYATSGNTLLIYDGTAGDAVTDMNYGVQTIQFDDGSTISVLAAGNTYTLSSGGTATGTGLNDVYSYAKGTGAATISDPGGQNILVMGAGIMSHLRVVGCNIYAAVGAH